MKKLMLAALPSSLFALTALSGTVVLADGSPDVAVEQMTITGVRDDRKSSGATGLDMGVYETPQSLTIIDSAVINDFALSDINALLKMTTGINVDSTETDRTYYNARGFDITSMHIDGIGMPFGSLVVGDVDTALYEKVEIIRGSNGLITGLGNPSGTINYVRKRPTNEFTGSVKLTGGSWDNRRAELDVSTPLTSSGSWAARGVLVAQEKDSWLDHYSNERQLGYLVVDGQLTDDVTLAVGYSRQDNNSEGVLWGAVPVIYNNGEQADYDVATSTTMDWTYWNTLTDETFVELGWEINQNWRLTASAMHTDYEEHSEVFYIYWNEGLDADTGLGLLSYPGKFDDEKENLILDANLNGRFMAWGLEHQLQLGISSADSDSESYAHDALSGFVSMPAFPGWTGAEVERPIWDSPYQSAHQDISLDRIYGSLLLAVSDNINLTLGLNMVDYNNEGVSYGVPTDSQEDGSSPYIGFTWELADNLNLYASYSDIYQPQYVLGEDLQSLGSAEGKSYELGLKKSFANNALVTLALFRTEQSNLEEFKEYGDGDGIDDTDYSDDFDYSIYRGIDVESQGVELEVAGSITDQISVQAGYTYLELEDPNGDDARTFIPRNSAKLLLTWNPSAVPDLAMGLSTRWQDEVYFTSAYGRIAQDSYAVVGGYARYKVTDNFTLNVNLDNLTDDKYFSSVKYEQAYYAAPRSINVSASVSF
ncbi:TonB-dependent siderophore receptor [Gilvimarinus agarilyticus]|uniref:TonB-dependent siderophore receptor n=1 Tax=Gilvimarinus sp. 2_MG-2023 TaxID=3062666 RepID=UPI001C0969D8|nr:TonB-dependent siderophore receptor [Gilvimarinus sp. 2_MG-2023]MBU2884963.1 TonB-dependent siderophore receptor [Gilvimarinus agarilyticus]MDO6569861.1 TonB-dependent siderophore receptor [Gilvimarinus sp. 2_MG-2023]